MTLEELVRQDCPDLSGRGRRLFARCPLHADKTPSLCVEPDKGLWVCYAGCGGGDAIEWCRRVRGQLFRDAYHSVHGADPPDRAPPPPDPARDRRAQFERWRSEHYLDAVAALCRAQEVCAALARCAEAPTLDEDFRRIARVQLWQEKQWLKYYEHECTLYDPNPLANHTWAWERWEREQEVADARE